MQLLQTQGSASCLACMHPCVCVRMPDRCFPLGFGLTVHGRQAFLALFAHVPEEVPADVALRCSCWSQGRQMGYSLQMWLSAPRSTLQQCLVAQARTATAEAPWCSERTSQR